MKIHSIILSIIIMILAARTLTWHLQTWQLREYRFDRMRNHLKTRDGFRNIFSLWFFRGILPRPKASGRILIILFLFFIILSADLFGSFFLTSKCMAPQIGDNYSQLCRILHEFWMMPLWVNFLVFERFIWLYVLVSVALSKIPVWIAKKSLFSQAKKIITSAENNITKIAITGSYGKSSTKQILVHLLSEYYEPENVLYNPENQNHEIALARLIKKSADFFRTKTSQQKFCVLEAGAYRKGDLKTVCQYYQPNISILTAVGTQHMGLFGSQKNIQEAKFELAEGAQEKVFFNADNKLLDQIFADKEIKATPIGISKKSAEKIQTHPDSTTFEMYGQTFTLPWPGAFFVENAVLALETARELGVPIEKLPQYLSSLPPLERALCVKKNPRKNYQVFKDLYSANTNGVLAAIKHLGQMPHQKVFVGTPLLELGKEARKSHEQIFYALKEINAETWWLKDDYQELGKKILGKKFHGKNQQSLKKMEQKLHAQDAVLLESKVPEDIIKIFE